MNQLNRPYVKNPSRYFTPIYLPMETYSFYLNQDITINDTSDFELRVVQADSAVASPISITIGLMSKVLTLGFTGYDLYMDNFVFPQVPDGEYYFIVYALSPANEACRSNLILVSSDCLFTTTPIKYRHNDQLFGVRYDLLPNFYQLMRVPLAQIKAPEIRSTREQYRQASNGRELRNSKSFRDIVLTVEMYWADDDDFGALSAMLEHTEIWVADNKLISMNQVKTSKPTEDSKLSKGEFEIIVDTYKESNIETLDGYGEFILWGGNEYNNVTTFTDGN